LISLLACPYKIPKAKSHCWHAHTHCLATCCSIHHSDFRESIHHWDSCSLSWTLKRPRIRVRHPICNHLSQLVPSLSWQRTPHPTTPSYTWSLFGYG
jgi:hypothetical protein